MRTLAEIIGDGSLPLHPLFSEQRAEDRVVFWSYFRNRARLQARLMLADSF